MKISYRVFGHSLTNIVLQQSFFGHFCAGESADLIKPSVDYLNRNGVGSILDYASESDVNEEETHTPQDESTPINPNKVQCRVYDYRDENLCDLHTQTFEKCIRAVHAVSPTGFAAIKCTALGNPKLLEAMSVAIVELRKLFLKFDIDKTGFVSREQFAVAYNKFFTGGDVESIFATLDRDNNQIIDYIEWSNGLALEDLYKLTSHCREEGPLSKAALDENERQLLKRMRERIHGLAALAHTLGVRIMIDAEHTYFQPAIDYITVDLAKTFNKTYPVVFGTYQMYLKDSRLRLLTDIERARKDQYKFAAKLVRGAYMVLERNRAEELTIDDPINPTIAATHENYNGAVREVISRIASGEDIEIMIASHNQQSVELALGAMSDFGLPPSARVYFGQLLGMSDNLSFSLGAAGYKAYKYVPYGKIEEVMPYLIRRAQENSDALGGASKEIRMVKSELWRRLTNA